MIATDATPARNDALTRASALANRAKELRRAQLEVQELTAREVQVLARAAATFFDTIPLPEFTQTLLPRSARDLRKVRHRIIHRTVQNSDAGTEIRALLLGRDGALRLFTARSEDSRDLLLIMEPGRKLPAGVVREFVEWSPALRVSGFRAFEILDRLSGTLDSVEEQIADAEHRVQVQKAALSSGDLSSLKAGANAGPQTQKHDVAEHVDAIAAPSPQLMIAASVESVSPAPEPPSSIESFESLDSPAEPESASAPADFIRRIDAIAGDEPEPVYDSESQTEHSGASDAIVAAASPATSELPDLPEPDEWDDPVEAPAPAETKKSASASSFPFPRSSGRR